MIYDWNQVYQDTKIIQEIWKQWFNGYHISEADWQRFNIAVDRINKLRKQVPKTVGVA